MNEYGYIESDGFKLRYRIEGEGSILLIIGSTIYYPRTFSSHLRTHLRLVFVEHRGFSRCNRVVNTKDADLKTIVEEIDKIREHLKIESMDILGHSGNAYLALEYARRYSHRVKHVVAVSVGPSLAKNHMDALERFWDDIVAPERKAILQRDEKALAVELVERPDEAFISHCVRLGARSWFDPSYDARPLWHGVQVNMPIVEHLWGDTFRNIDTHNLLREIPAPILLALGRFDYIIAPLSSWDEYRSSAKELTVRLFEKSAHSPQMEESQLFDQTLLSFLQKRNGPPEQR